MYYINNTTTSLVSGLMGARTWCNKLVKKVNDDLWGKGSLPNKLLMLGLNSAAAYAVGVNPVYLGVTILVTTLFFLNTTPRWMLESVVISNLILISTFTLPETSVTQLEYLILFKIIFELLCSVMDKGIQLVAHTTKDGKHSYYLFFILSVATVKFLVGYAVSFYQGFYGL